MSTLNRRAFTREALGSVLTFSLLDTLCSRDAFAEAIKPITAQWFKQVNDLAGDVKSQKLKQVEWQKQIEALYAQVDLPDLLRFIDFDKLSAEVDLPEHGARSLRPKFAEIDGVPTNLVFGRQVFAMRPGRSVVPHGHNNMATAFLILKGNFRGRHYDRLQDEPDHMILRPTIDRAFDVGEHSSISDYKDNVHWFTAQDDVGYIFNIHVMDVNPGSGKSTGRVYVDPQGEKLQDGTIRARRVNYEEVNKLYG
jgi:hypothetical protein